MAGGFNRVKDAQEYIKKLLTKNTLSKEEKSNVKIIFEQFYYPDGEEVKYRPDEIVDITVEPHPEYQHTKCIYLKLTNGQQSTMSYKRLKAKPPQDFNNQRAAFRVAIKDQIKQFRKDKKNQCESSDHEENNAANDIEYEVDHILPFNELMKAFQDEHEGPIEIIYNTLTRTYDFADKKIKEKWVNFHQINATLQLLCKTCHRKKTNTERR